MHTGSSTTDLFVLTLAGNTTYFIFESPLCTSTKGCNYPMSVISLHLPHKRPKCQGSWESQKLTNIICFFIFSWLLFCPSSTVNSQSNKQYRLYVCTVLGLLLPCGKYQHYNYQFDVVTRRKGHSSLVFSVFSFSHSTTFKVTTRYHTTLTRRHLIWLCPLLQGCHGLGRRSIT